MVVYCLENKRSAASFEEIEKEIQTLMGEGFNPHPDFFFRRLPLKAFSLPRETLWCLIYFHQGRNKITGAYYSRRTVQTKDGKSFRIGETIRLLEKEGYLVRRSTWSWYVPQEDVKTGRKNPAFRASFVNSFLDNPTKERRIALRYLLHLATLNGSNVTYRNIQAALGCATDLARYLARYFEDHHQGMLSRKRVQNRVFNWSKEGLQAATSSQKDPLLEQGKLEALVVVKSPVLEAEIAPIKDAITPAIEPKKAISCTESGLQYKGLNKEIQKKNPSTRPRANGESADGFSRSIKKVSLSELGFETGETLVANLNPEAKALEPYRNQFQSKDAFSALEMLYASARGKATFRDTSPDLLAIFMVDIWLEMLRKKSGFKTSVLGYFFSALRNNMASGYCRISQKKAALERQQQKQMEEARYLLAGELRDMDAGTRKRVNARCLQKDPGFFQIPIREYLRKTDLIQASFEELRDRGDLTAVEVALYEFCEASSNNRNNPLEFVKANPDLWKAYCETRSMQKAAA